MKEYLRYVFSVLAIILVIALFILGFNMIRKVVRQADAPQAKKTTTTQTKTIVKDFKNEPLIFTTRGAINGNEEHFSTRITVTPTVRRAEVLRGYNNEVIKTQETPNTQEAYNAFAVALDGAGFTTKVADAKDRGTEDKTCSLGRRFNYTVAPGMASTHFSWSTSCSGRQGTFAGNRSLVQQLFERQIPSYNDFVRGVRLS